MAKPPTLSSLSRDSEFRSSCFGQSRDLSLSYGDQMEGRLRDPKNPTHAYEPVHRKPSPAQALRGEKERENQEGARSRRGGISAEPGSEKVGTPASRRWGVIDSGATRPQASEATRHRCT